MTLRILREDPILPMGKSQVKMKTLDRDQVTEKVQEILAEVLNLPEGKPDPKARLVEDLGAESVDMLSLLLEFEEAFESEIPDEDLTQFVTVDSIVDYILKSLPAAASEA